MDAFNGHRAVFNFRVDVDHFYPPHVMPLLELAEKYDVKMSWYVTADAASRYPDFVKRLAQSQDVQSHSYVHRTYETENENRENMERAHKFFAGIGVDVEGFAAPFGKWNQSVTTAAEKMGYAYTSEFIEGNRIFPFFPEIGNRKSSVLQIPVHGISEGNLFDRGYNKAQVNEYFSKIVDYFYANSIPIFIYGHPEERLGRHPDILESIFMKIRQKEDVLHTTLTDYADFWIKEKPTAPKANYEANIFLEDHSNFLTPLMRKISLKSFYLKDALYARGIKF